MDDYKFKIRQNPDCVENILYLNCCVLAVQHSNLFTQQLDLETKIYPKLLFNGYEIFFFLVGKLLISVSPNVLAFFLV